MYNSWKGDGGVAKMVFVMVLFVNFWKRSTEGEQQRQCCSGDCWVVLLLGRSQVESIYGIFRRVLNESCFPPFTPVSLGMGLPVKTTVNL